MSLKYITSEHFSKQVRASYRVAPSDGIPIISSVKWLQMVIIRFCCVFLIHPQL